MNKITRIDMNDLKVADEKVAEENLLLGGRGLCARILIQKFRQRYIH